MSFQLQKSNQLSREDKSNEQKVDDKLAKLCEKINSKKEYYTTSSCGGRIILIKGKKEKSRNAFLFKTHRKISFPELKQELGKIKYRSLVYFKQETCILHVACSSLESALKLLEKAKFAGWKRSGIMSSNKRVMLELMSTEKLELPLMNKGKLRVPDSYLRLLVKEANSRLERVWGKIKKLENLV